MAMENRYQTLKQLLDHPEFTEGHYWGRTCFDPGQVVIREGECNSEIYVVLKGSLMVCTDVEITESVHLNSGLCELFDGEEFSLSCFFDHEPHSASVKTLSECELAVLDAGRLRVFFAHHPDIGYQILNHWVQCLLPRLRRDNRRIATLLSWGLKVHHIDTELKSG